MAWGSFLTKTNMTPGWQHEKHSTIHANSENNAGVISRLLRQYTLMGDSSAWFSSSHYSQHNMECKSTMVESAMDLHSSSCLPEQTQGDTLDTSLNSSTNSDDSDDNENMEVEIVFDKDVKIEKTFEDSASVSSEAVLTDHWDPILLAALGEDDSQSTTTASGSSSSSDGSSCGEEEANEWTDLTKYPQILEDPPLVEQFVPPKTTTLSEKLQAGDYKAVEERILSHPKEVFTIIDLPEGQQVQGYPLHLACALRPLPPLSIFQLLLSVYPNAAKRSESKWGMLPLHFASNLSVLPDTNHVQVIEALLSIYEDAKTIPESFQGQTPLHLAAASTPQTLDGMIPSTSFATLNLLSPNKEQGLLWVTDINDKTAQDVASERVSRTTIQGESGWKFNPLLAWKRPGEKEEDATSVTMSISSGSFTSGSCNTPEQVQAPTSDDSQEKRTEQMEEDGDKDEVISISDNDTFFTARSHEQSTVQMDNTNERAHALAKAIIPSSNDSNRDEVESILTDEQESNMEDLVVPEPPAVEERQVFKSFIPRALQVDKVLLHMQIQASDLIRPRNSTKKAIRSHLFPKRSVNPYYEVELVHPELDISVSLHKSKAFFNRREALWEPIRFAIDASMAKARGMVLSINMYHKKQKSKGKSKKDEWIGGHQASPRELNESVNEISLKCDQMKTGKFRLVSYQMVPLERADCWRIFM